MKMMYAGLAGDNAVAEKWRFNCTRNRRCQKTYYVPIKSISDLLLFFDLPFQPTSYELQVITCEGNEYGCVPCDYVIGTSPNGKYAIFSALSLINGGDFNDDFSNDFNISVGNGGQAPQPTCFYIKASFFNGATQAVYFSNDICLEKCDPLTKVEACYNDTAIGAQAFDVNGTYFGYPIDGTTIGNANLRYLHSLYVRKGSVTGTKSKLSLSLFNYVRPYKTQANKYRNFQCELVPEFYKDEIFAILARGVITVDDVMYKLDDEIELNVNDQDSKLWIMDIGLMEQFFSYFSCKTTVCQLPAVQCSNNWDAALGDTPNKVVLSNGTLNEGEQIVWQLLLNNNLFCSGFITADNFTDAPQTFDLTTCAGYDADNCYVFKYIKRCVCAGTTEGESDNKTISVGNCCCTPSINTVTYETVDAKANILNINAVPDYSLDPECTIKGSAIIDTALGVNADLMLLVTFADAVTQLIPITILAGATGAYSDNVDIDCDHGAITNICVYSADATLNIPSMLQC